MRKGGHEDCWPVMKAAALEADTKGPGFFGQLKLRSELVVRLEQQLSSFEGQFRTWRAFVMDIPDNESTESQSWAFESCTSMTFELKPVSTASVARAPEERQL